MGCSNDHCCKGGCYQVCETVFCEGTRGYGKSECRIPVGRIDCLEVVDFAATSCNRIDSFEIEDGVLHVRNNCRATFKICSGPVVTSFNEDDFPVVPHKIPDEIPLVPPSLPTPNNGKLNSTKAGDVFKSTKPSPASPSKPPNTKFGEGVLHTNIATDMSDSEVMAVDLGIGIGIGVVLAILAVVAFILCRRYHLRKLHRQIPPHLTQPVTSSTNQAGNPLYCIDAPGPVRQGSTFSGRYEEIGCPGNLDILSRTSSEPNYESIPSDTLSNNRDNENRTNNIEISTDYQTVADDISSKPKLQKTGSDVVYNTYFHTDNSNRTSSMSNQYFVLDPNDSSREDVEKIEPQSNDIKVHKTDNTYFVLEKE